MYNKYKYYVTDNKVIAVSRDGGQSVKGVAKCCEGDTFNEEYGKKLAAAKCNAKVAVRRVKRAEDKRIKLINEIEKLNLLLIKANIDLENEQIKLIDATAYLADILAEG